MTSGTSGSAGAWLEEDDVELRPGEESVLRADDPVLAARERAFRDVLGRFATGVTVVTGLSDGSPVGLTCQSFSSVSLDPPLVMFAPARTSRSWPLIQRSGHFCVNILAADQVDVSRTMASRGADKFAGLGWTPSRMTGSPVLAGTLGHVDCLISAVHESGDHFVVIGRVLDLAVTEVEDPLLYFRGAYRTIGTGG